jgi:hypothetical protein
MKTVNCLAVFLFIFFPGKKFRPFSTKKLRKKKFWIKNLIHFALRKNSVKSHQNIFIFKH